MVLRGGKMKISKTGFVNLIRCNRFAALEEININKQDSIVTFSKNMDDLMTIENLAKKNALLTDMYENQENKEILKSDLQFEVMKPYYDKVEILTANAVKKHFEGRLTYSANTYNQKRFLMEKDGYQFYCFLDGFLQTEDGFMVFETKATTSRKFIKMAANKEPLFMQTNNILRLKKDLGYKVGPKYPQQEKKFFDKYNDIGAYVYDLAFQRYVIENSKGFNSKEHHQYYLAVLNADYVFDGKKDENGEPIYTDDIITFIDLTSVTKDYLPIINKDMQKVIHRLDTMNASPVDLGKFCQFKKNRECKFVEICFNKIPQNVSILNYLDNHHGFKDGKTKYETYELINKGYLHMLDIPESWMTRKNNILQRQVIKTRVSYYNKGKIKAGVKEIKYPIYHLDFESFPCPLPRYKGEKPYSQSLFQFSVHIEKEVGKCDKDLDNYSFLVKDHGDYRKQLVEKLLDVIKPDGGSVCVYNINFEKTRIKELALLYPEYEDRLFDLANRLFDLFYLVRTNKTFYKSLGYDEDVAGEINYYHEDLGGSYSIKKVLPLFSDLSYEGMSVAKGDEAFAAYSRLPYLKEEEFEKLYQEMIDYCKQDTWALVKILEGLRAIS